MEVIIELVSGNHWLEPCCSLEHIFWRCSRGLANNISNNLISSLIICKMACKGAIVILADKLEVDNLWYVKRPWKCRILLRFFQSSCSYYITLILRALESNFWSFWKFNRIALMLVFWIMNLKVIPIKLLSPPNLSKAWTFCIYKST